MAWCVSLLRSRSGQWPRIRPIGQAESLRESRWLQRQTRRALGVDRGLRRVIGERGLVVIH